MKKADKGKSKMGRSIKPEWLLVQISSEKKSNFYPCNE